MCEKTVASVGGATSGYRISCFKEYICIQLKKPWGRDKNKNSIAQYFFLKSSVYCAN